MNHQHAALPLLDFALAPFAEFMSDDTVEDIIMNRPNEVFVRRGATTTRHEVAVDFVDQQGIAILAAAIKGQNVGRATPLLSCDLPGGTRLQAVLPPCVNDGTVALAIRRAKKTSPTLDQLAAGGIFSGVEPLRDGLSHGTEALVTLYHEACGATGPDQRHRAWTAFLRATMKARMTHVLCGEVGSGKAQPDESPVLTPTGFRPIGDLSVGDFVTAPDGTATRVSGIYPQGEKLIHKVTFSDGRTVECCDDHLWKVWYLGEDCRRGLSREGWRVAPLSQIREWMKSRAKAVRLLAVPLVDTFVINLPPQDLPIAPYALGALLGDGCLTAPTTVKISSIDDHILYRVIEDLPEYELSQVPGKPCVYRLRQKIRTLANPLKKALAELGIRGLWSHEKFVPEIYKQGSLEQRLAVLQGLMDTDGSVGNGTHASFSSTSERLARDVQELCWSFGAITKIKEWQTYFTGTDGEKKAGKKSWRVSIVHQDISQFFSLPRKLKECTHKVMQHRLRIVSIEPVGMKHARCIRVDHPDHLYVTNNYVVTHNTFFGMGLANEIPLDDRLVTVQDSDEWSALPHRNRTDLFYSKGGQGAANVTPNDLVEASLRLAMRWLLLQELRGAEAFSFLRARRSGHPGLTTCHASSTREVFPTLALMVKQAPAASSVELTDIEASLTSLIDVVVHFHRPEGRFAVSEVWFRHAEAVA